MFMSHGLYCLVCSVEQNTPQDIKKYLHSVSSLPYWEILGQGLDKSKGALLYSNWGFSAVCPLGYWTWNKTSVQKRGQVFRESYHLTCLLSSVRFAQNRQTLSESSEKCLKTYLLFICYSESNKLLYFSIRELSCFLYAKASTTVFALEKFHWASKTNYPLCISSHFECGNKLPGSIIPKLKEMKIDRCRSGLYNSVLIGVYAFHMTLYETTFWTLSSDL